MQNCGHTPKILTCASLVQATEFVYSSCGWGLLTSNLEGSWGASAGYG